MKISAVLIAKNEAACIERCLKSLKDFDEIITLDTGSIDSTPAICKKYGKVFHYVWNDDFAAARNKALSYARGDWVLSIDADEWLDNPELVRFAIEDKAQVMNVKVITTDEHGVYQTTTNQGRLFRRDKSIYWRGVAHNYLNKPATKNTEIRIISTPDGSSRKADPERTIRILSNFLKTHPMNAREVFYLGIEYFYREVYDAAAYWLEYFTEISGKSPELAEGWLTLAKCYRELGRKSKAVYAAMQALTINPDFSEGYRLLYDCTGNEIYKRIEVGCGNTNVLIMRP